MRRPVTPIACLLLAPMVAWLALDGLMPQPPPETVVCAHVEHVEHVEHEDVEAIEVAEAQPSASPEVVFVGEAGAILDQCVTGDVDACLPMGPWRVDAVARRVWRPVSKPSVPSPLSAWVHDPVVIYNQQGEACLGRLGEMAWVSSIPQLAGETGQNIDALLDAGEDAPEQLQAQLQALAYKYPLVFVAAVPARCEGARWVRPAKSVSGPDFTRPRTEVALHGHTSMQAWVANGHIEGVVSSLDGTLRHVRQSGESVEVLASSPAPLDEPCGQ